MTDIELPTYRDLMLPTLVAVDRLGGSAAIPEIEELVPEIAGISDEQLGVEFPEGSTQQGNSKVVHRLYWARTYLKKIGALNNSKQTGRVVTHTKRSGLPDHGRSGGRHGAQKGRHRRESRDASLQGQSASGGGRRR